MRTTSGRCTFTGIGLLAALSFASGFTAAAELDRSPSDLALTPDGRWAVTANTTSGTVSLVDLAEARVAAEIAVGERPLAVAVSHDGTQAVVTNWLSDSLTLLRVDPPNLEPVVTLSVGDEPRGVAFSADGKHVYVVLSGENAVVTMDLEQRKQVARAAVGQEPWHLALTRDGRRLAVGNSLSRTVTVLDAATLRPAHTVRLHGRNVRHLAVSDDGTWAYVPFIAERGRSTTEQHIDRGWVIGNRIGRVPLGEAGPREAIAMDTRGQAVADLDGIAVSPDGKRIAVTAGGTHEVILLRTPLPFVAYGGPDDHIDPELLNDAHRFRRVPVGGRPLGVSFTPDGDQLVVANYLANAVQVVDFDSAKITKTIPLGGPEMPSLARRGESIFYDARRSFNQWYSCHSCHTDGHTNGGLFDTFGDGRYENPKKVLSLRGVMQTAPWTWHGVKTNLRDSLRQSFETTMRGPEPTDEELGALAAYLQTLDFVPPPAIDRDLAARGQTLFQEKQCDTCHLPPHFTNSEIYEVGLESQEDEYQGFNPPSLRGVGRRAPYLHDGRARTLEEVLKVHHRPSQLSGHSDLTDQELAELIEYLRSL